MSISTSSKSTYLIHNTLASILKGLINVYTIIDLRNENSIRGKIVDCDGFMNVELEDCLFQNTRGEEMSFQSFFIRARNIRYVHIPEGYTSKMLIEKALTKRTTTTKKDALFRAKRAKQKQQQTLREIYKTGPSTSRQN